MKHIYKFLLIKTLILSNIDKGFCKEKTIQITLFIKPFFINDMSWFLKYL